MRSKEAHDYRYFPEPDLVPMELGEEYISDIRKTLPELPEKRKERFVAELGLSEYDAGVLTAEKALADYFEQALKHASNKLPQKKVVKTLTNWITNEYIGKLYSGPDKYSKSLSKLIQRYPITPADMADLVIIIENGTISGKIGKTVLDEMFASAKSPEEIVKEKGLLQISDEGAIIKLCEEAINDNPKAVADINLARPRRLARSLALL